MYTKDDDLRTVNILQRYKEDAADTPSAVTPLGHYMNGMTKYSNCQPLEDCTNQHERSGWHAAWQADNDWLIDGQTYLERAESESSELEGRQYHNFCGPQNA